MARHGNYMDYFETYVNLSQCFARVKIEEYIKLSEAARNEVCGEERRVFVNQLNSESMSMTELIKLQINLLKGMLYLIVEREAGTAKYPIYDFRKDV
jgi:hypothetical protein